MSAYLSTCTFPPFRVCPRTCMLSPVHACQRGTHWPSKMMAQSCRHQQELHHGKIRTVHAAAAEHVAWKPQQKLTPRQEKLSLSRSSETLGSHFLTLACFLRHISLVFVFRNAELVCALALFPRVAARAADANSKGKASAHIRARSFATPLTRHADVGPVPLHTMPCLGKHSVLNAMRVSVKEGAPYDDLYRVSCRTSLLLVTSSGQQPKPLEFCPASFTPHSGKISSLKTPIEKGLGGSVPPVVQSTVHQRRRTTSTMIR